MRTDSFSLTQFLVRYTLLALCQNTCSIIKVIENLKKDFNHHDNTVLRKKFEQRKRDSLDLNSMLKYNIKSLTFESVFLISR